MTIYCARSNQRVACENYILIREQHNTAAATITLVAIEFVAIAMLWIEVLVANVCLVTKFVVAVVVAAAVARYIHNGGGLCKSELIQGTWQ